jgi:hypothetical protein
LQVLGELIGLADELVDARGERVGVLGDLGGSVRQLSQLAAQEALPLCDPVGTPFGVVQAGDEAVEATGEVTLATGDSCRAVGCFLQAGKELVLKALLDLGQPSPGPSADGIGGAQQVSLECVDDEVNALHGNAHLVVCGLEAGGKAGSSDL